MRRLIAAFLGACLAAGAVHAREPAVVRGEVVDGKGDPVPFANVQLAGTTDGAATGRDGRFRFATRHLGERRVVASFIGREPARRTVRLAPGDTAAVRLVLRRVLIELGETAVTASTWSTGEKEDVTLSPLDVVTTAGAAADIFQALKTFPGAAMVDDGAGLYVRGGDVSETLILLDQATVVHPYRHESPTGGVFGTIPPFMTKGTVFSTGGFPARYGNTLSAVLAMESQDLPPRGLSTLSLGLAALSLGVDAPVVPDRLGLRLSGNLSLTDLLFRVNGQAGAFETYPRSRDGNLNLVYRYSPSGRLKLFSFATGDRLGVRVEEPSFDGFYRSRSAGGLHNLQWTHVHRGWLIRSSASLNRYSARRQLGNLDLEPADLTAKLRADLEGGLGDRMWLRFGGETERMENRFRGTVPRREDIFDPEAEVFELDHDYGARRAGAYMEVDLKPAHDVAVNAGLRADHHDLAGRLVFDPRLSARWSFNSGTDLRLGWGIYHQFPAPREYDPVSGNPGLGPQRAQHWVAGLTHERRDLMMRAEAYHKPYRDLVLHDPRLNYTNGGRGRASGLDLFLKHGGFLQTRVSGWASYSLLRSRRLQPRHLGREVSYEQAPSPFDITHNLTLVGKAQLTAGLTGGLTLKAASGRPVTPVIDAVPAEGGGYYLPVEGPVGSERLPAFHRLDGNLSYLRYFGSGHQAVFFLAVNNLLDRANILDYEYNLDYSERRPRATRFRRSVYFGAVITLNR